MTSTEEKRAAYSKMKSWADHCSSDEESDDELHPARLASTSNMDDLSYESEGHISVTAEDNLEELGLGAGGGGGNPNGHGNGGGGRGGRRRNNTHEEVPEPKPIDFNNLPPELPKQPPFTAYIRNLCYKIQEPDELAGKVEGMTRWRYKKQQHEVRVINARLGLDRETGKRKGFGYVEFETAEELMLFLNLNDGFSQINGRDLIIDIANNSRGPRRNNSNRNNNFHRQSSESSQYNNSSSNLPDIDGKKFQGGRYSKSNNNNYDNSRGNGENNGAKDSAPPMERRSLKLAPRSKPMEGAERSASQSSSIFGDAKPRDEQNWRKKKEELNIAAGAVRTESEKKDSEENEPTSVPSDVTVENADASPTPTTSNALDNTKDDQQQQQQQQQHGNGERNGGRGGGRGRGRGGERKNNSRGTSGSRGGRGGRGRNNRRNSERNRNSNQSSKDPDGWDEAKGGLPPQQPTTKAPLVEKKESKSTKVANKFAAFLDSDSESD